MRVLVISQAVGALGMTIGFATASLLARDISGSDTQSGLVQTCQVLGAAVASYLLARVMSRRGRRVGLVTGYLIGATGSVLAVAGGVAESMALLLVGAALLGATSAANNSSRYAATDLAPEHSRARALSIVVWASTIGAVAGPNLTGFGGWTAQQLSLPELTGPFAVGAVGMLAAGLVLFVALRPDPLLVARQAADVPVVSHTSWRRAFTVVRERPLLLAAMVVLAGAHAAMIMVMVMTPLHMEHGGADLEIIGVVISVHVLGMFAFAPVVGFVADRVGRAPGGDGGRHAAPRRSRRLRRPRPRAPRGRCSSGCSCSAWAGRSPPWRARRCSPTTRRSTRAPTSRASPTSSWGWPRPGRARSPG